MKQNPDEKLLRDVLRQATDGFRQEVLEASLKELRQKKAHARTWPGLPLAIAAAFVLGIGLLLYGIALRTKKEDRLRPGASALEYAQIEIVTNHGPAITIVENRQYPSIIVMNSNVRQPVEVLGDTDLLALFPNDPVGLIPNSQGAVQLVFLDSRAPDQLFRQ
jgi:hypothetical protein